MVDSKKLPCLIAVHAGAGYHTKSLDAQYISKRDNVVLHTVMKESCQLASQIIQKENGCILQAVEAAIMHLENCSLLNAGNGSNLNMNGYVECDASAMSDDGAFGSIGAAPGIQNPIQAAVLLAKESKIPLPHGLIRPMMVVGDCAREYALKNKLKGALDEITAKELHKTSKSIERYEKYMDILCSDDDASENGTKAKKKQKLMDKHDLFLDTVGCVVVNYKGDVASGVSSGGIWLKTPGRVGEAAMYGAGCWALRSHLHFDKERRDGMDKDSSVSIATSVSGVGEHIMKKFVAKELATNIFTNRNHVGIGGSSTKKGEREEEEREEEGLDMLCASYLQNLMKSSPGMSTSTALHKAEWECGVLALVATREKMKNKSCIRVELGAAHIACPSMALGYYSPEIGCNGIILRNSKSSRNNEEEKKENIEANCFDIGALWSIDDNDACIKK